MIALKNIPYFSGNKLDSINDKVVRAILLQRALLSVMLAKGLSASPQHSMYFGCLDFEVKVPPPVVIACPQEVFLPPVDPLCDKLPFLPLSAVPSCRY